MEETRWQVEDKTFIVTGANSGTSTEIAKFLDARDSNIVLRERDRAQVGTIVDGGAKADGRALTVELDLEKSELIGQLVRHW